MQLDKVPKRDSIVDNLVNNPAYDLLGGYQLFLRRVTIPITLMLILLFSYSILSNFMNSQNSTFLAFGLTGLLLGPVLNFDRFMAQRLK